MLIPGICGVMPGAEARPWLATDYGALIAMADNNTSSQAQAAAVLAVSNPFTAYDPRAFKLSNTTFQVPPGVDLLRLQGDAYLSSGAGGAAYRMRKWDGAAYVDIDGSGQSRGHRTGATNENAHCAILAVSAGDLFQFQKVSGPANTADNGGTRNWFSAEVIPPNTRYTFAVNTIGQTFPAATFTDVVFNSNVADTLGTRTGTTSQFIVGAGTSGKLRVNAWACAGAAGGGSLSLRIRLNGVDVAGSAANSGGGTSATGVAGPILTVVPGDIITIAVHNASGTTIASGLGARAWCCIEELPANHRYCQLQKSANQGVGAGTVITWDTEIHDPENAHSLVTNTHRITIPADAREWRTTWGGAATTTNLGYESSNKAGAGYAWAGYAGCANGRTIFNAMGPWHPKTYGEAGAYTAVEMFGSGSFVAGVPTSFFQVEWR